MIVIKETQNDLENEHTQLYAVVKYFNCREVSIKIVNITKTFDKADKLAQKLAQKYYNKKHEKLSNEVEDYFLDINTCSLYTKSDGYEKYVFCVVELPKVLLPIESKLFLNIESIYF